MYIKKILINNFKSYKGLHAIENVRPSHNSLIGLNGAGKTNFLKAITFVLTFENKPIRKKYIKTLLNDRAIEGFVEVELSGCEEPSENELIIRKEFSLVSDITYFINKTKLKRKEVMTIFEIYNLYSAQSIFSVSAITVNQFMESSRNEILTHLIMNMGMSILETYNFNKKILMLFEDQKDQIDNLIELFDQIIPPNNDYLKELKRIKNIYKTIEASILKRKIKKWTDKRIELQESLYSLNALPINDSTSDIELTIFQSSNTLKSKLELLDELVAEEFLLLTKIEKLNLCIEDNRNEIKTLQMLENEEPERKLYIMNRISIFSEELEEASRVLKLKKDQVTHLDEQKKLKENNRLQLLLKMQKAKDFSSIKERNTYLKKKIHSLNEKIKQTVDNEYYLSIQNEKIIERKYGVSEKIQKLKNETLELESLNRSISQNKQQVNSLFDSLKECQRLEKSTEDKISDIVENIQEIGLQLKKKIGESIVIGNENILTIVEACKDSESHRWISMGHFGLVVDNFECSEELNIAIETAIGKRLFAHVVQNNKISTELVKEMNNHNLQGEVTFIPIENVVQYSYQYPLTDDAVPMINRIKFEPYLERAMNFVFGGIMICHNIDVAVNIMKKKSMLACVTLEGDKVSRDTLYGGYFSKSKSSMSIYSNICSLQIKNQSETKELEKIKKSIDTIETDINRVRSSIELAKQKQNKKVIKDSLILLNNEKQRLQNDLLDIKETIKGKKVLINHFQYIRNLLQQELTEDFETIRERDNCEIIKLNQEINEVSKLLNRESTQLIAQESNYSILKNNLNNSEKLRHLQDEESAEIRDLLKKNNNYVIKGQVVEYRLDKIRKEIEVTKNSIIETEKLKLMKEKEIQEYLESESLVMDKVKQNLIKKLTICTRKIYEYEKSFIALRCPSNILKKFSDFSLLELKEKKNNSYKSLKELQQVVELEKTRIKMARSFDQCQNLQTNFVQSYVMNADFVEWFDKYLYTNLENISDNFTLLFGLLSNGGEANLFLYEDSSSQDVSSSQNCFDVEQITGILMNVQFPMHPEIWDLVQLSFGQKVIIMLTVMFSIIKVSPTHFYIIDEIDGALTDNQKRFVSNIISKLEFPLQIFSSSHSLEWIKRGAFIYYVTMKNMRSTIKEMTENVTIDFIESSRESSAIEHPSISSILKN